MLLTTDTGSTCLLVDILMTRCVHDGGGAGWVAQSLQHEHQPLGPSMLIEEVYKLGYNGIVCGSLWVAQNGIQSTYC
jgi:hypothetical protein